MPTHLFCFAFLAKSCLYQCFDEERLQEILQGQSVLARRIADECQEMFLELKASLPAITAKLKEQATRNLLHRAAHENWNDDRLIEEQEKAKMQIAERIEKLKAEMDKKVEDYEEKCRHEAALFIILDDLGSGGAMGNWMVKYIMNNGRHHLALMNILLQRGTDMPGTDSLDIIIRRTAILIRLLVLFQRNLAVGWIGLFCFTKIENPNLDCYGAFMHLYSSRLTNLKLI